MIGELIGFRVNPDRIGPAVTHAVELDSSAFG